MLVQPTPIAQIPVVPLPPAPIRPVGRDAEPNLMLVSAPWIGAGAVLILIAVILFRLWMKATGPGGISPLASLSHGPQVRPVRDPKYWKLMLEGERESKSASRKPPATTQHPDSKDSSDPQESFRRTG